MFQLQIVKYYTGSDLGLGFFSASPLKLTNQIYDQLRSIFSILLVKENCKQEEENK